MDDAVLNIKLKKMEEEIEALKKQNEEQRQQIEKLECKAGFARQEELERVRKERAEQLAEAGMTEEDFLEANKAHKPSPAEVAAGVVNLKGQLDAFLDEGKIDEPEHERVMKDIVDKAMQTMAHLEEDKDEAIEEIARESGIDLIEVQNLHDKYLAKMTVEKPEGEEEEEEADWFDGGKEKAWFEV